MADYNHFHKPDVSRISLMWDPSSYSGFEYNVGMIYTMDGNFMLALPVKVPMGISLLSHL